MSSIHADQASPPTETGPSREAELEAFLSRNRTVLDESIERSRTEIAAGVHDPRTIEDIIAEGRERRRAAP